MLPEWADVESLIGELGAVRAASLTAHLSAAAATAIEDAIREATDAVVATLDAPREPRAISRARDAIEVAQDVMAALDVEILGRTALAPMPSSCAGARRS
jgi:ABC-type transporter MlaC component